MKFIRPAMEIEAMPLRNDDGVVYAYLCDFGEKATPILSVDELVTRGFRQLNGHEPGKPLKRRKKINLTIEEAPLPDIPANGGLMSDLQEPTRIREALQVEPAQEYDHQ